MAKGKKTGGRVKGTPNKQTADIALALDAMGCQPLTIMARLAMSTKASLELQGAMAARLARMLYPEKKAIEHTGPGGGPIQTSDVSPRELLAARIARIAERKRTS